MAARALRAALRELALANTVGEAPSEERRAAIDAALGAFPLVVRVGGDGPGVAPAGSGATRGLAAIVAVVAAAQRGGDLGPAQGLPPGHVRLAVLRRLAQPLVELVLHADLRRA